MSQATLPTPSSRTTSPTAAKAANRQSMPPQRTPASPPASSAAGAPQPAPKRTRPFDATPEEDSDSDSDSSGAPRARKGTMSKSFRFPPETAPPLPELPPSVLKAEPEPPVAEARQSVGAHAATDSEEVSLAPVGAAEPSAMEVGPPPPVEKERVPATPGEIGDEDVGETEEISLN